MSLSASGFGQSLVGQSIGAVDPSGGSMVRKPLYHTEVEKVESTHMASVWFSLLLSWY